MPTDLAYLALSVLLGFVHVMAAGAAATNVRGLAWNAGPRDEQMPPLTGVAGRLERASRNFLETFPFFLAAVALVYFTGREGTLSVLGAALYFWARLVYLPLYAFGVPFVRSLAWAVAMAGIGLLLVVGAGLA